MKRLSILSLVALLLVGATGCLKDKGFNAGNYGIQISEIKAVAFPGASISPLSYGLDVSASPQVVPELVNVTLETGSAAEADIAVSLTNTTGTAAAGDIKKYNDAHPGANVQILPSAIWSVPLTLTIPTGQKFVKANITVTNTTGLNPNLSYGIGLTISSASNGYQVAANQRNIVVIFSVKNKYDGRYNLTGFHNRAPYTFPYDVEMHLITTGPSSVIFYWPDVGSFGHPIGIGPGNSLSWYGPAISPNIMFDPATDLVSSVFNTGAGGPVIDKYPAGSYSGLPTTPAFRVNRFDPSNRSIVVDFRYAGLDLRGFFDNMTYLGPR